LRQSALHRSKRPGLLQTPVPLAQRASLCSGAVGAGNTRASRLQSSMAEPRIFILKVRLHFQEYEI
jgi:hypothetical protein